MKIGMMSDTHDHLIMIARAFDLFESRGCEATIHAGDFVAPFAVKRIKQRARKLYWVFGNNDGEREGIQTLLGRDPGVRVQFAIGPLRFALAHRVEDLGGIESDVNVFGHTHEAGVTRSEGRLFVNPGECCGWTTGKATVALLDTETGHAEICELR